jgi:uncharacterized protein
MFGEIIANGNLLGMDNQEIHFSDASRPVDWHSRAARRDAVLRSAVFWVGFFVCLFLMRILIGFLGLSQPAAGDTRGQWCGGILMTVLTLALTRIFVRMETGPVVEPGTRLVTGSIPRAFLGLLCVIPLSALSILSLRWLIPGVRFVRAEISILSVVSAIGLYLVLAAYEEIGFRGYPMRRLLRSFGVWPTLLLIAPVFAFYHISLGWGLFPALIGTGAGSLLFGMAAVAARRGLAFPIGVHAGWNFTTWSLGVGNAGIFKMTFPAVLTERVQAIGMCAYLTCMLFGTLLLWFWSKRGERQAHPWE